MEVSGYSAEEGIVGQLLCPPCGNSIETLHRLNLSMDRITQTLPLLFPVSRRHVATTPVGLTGLEIYGYLAGKDGTKPELQSVSGNFEKLCLNMSSF
jgi:hypothetical protein